MCTKYLIGNARHEVTSPSSRTFQSCLRLTHLRQPSLSLTCKMTSVHLYPLFAPFSPQTGSLAVPEGRDIIPQINSLLSLPFKLKVASRDHHPSDHISFVTSHPGKQTFEKVKTTHPAVPGEEREQVLWPVPPVTCKTKIGSLCARNGRSCFCRWS
jgi:hypothetical protein